MSASAVDSLDLPGLPRQGGVRNAVARAVGAAPPPGLVLLSIVSIQIGAALAVHLFPALGPAGTVFLRVGLAAFLLMLGARPALDRNLLAHGWLLLQFGCVMGAMNLRFYEAIARIPLGTAVTVGFIGPLGVAALTSRRPLDFFWIGLAVVGLAVLAPRLGGTLDPWGVLLAAIAAAGWSGFILLSRRVGQAFPGGSGLALGMVVAAIFLVPFGIAGARAALLDRCCSQLRWRSRCSRPRCRTRSSSRPCNACRRERMGCWSRSSPRLRSWSGRSCSRSRSATAPCSRSAASWPRRSGSPGPTGGVGI